MSWGWIPAKIHGFVVRRLVWYGVGPIKRYFVMLAQFLFKSCYTTFKNWSELSAWVETCWSLTPDLNDVTLALAVLILSKRLLFWSALKFSHVLLEYEKVGRFLVSMMAGTLGWIEFTIVVILFCNASAKPASALDCWSWLKCDDD